MKLHISSHLCAPYYLGEKAHSFFISDISEKMLWNLQMFKVTNSFTTVLKNYKQNSIFSSVYA